MSLFHFNYERIVLLNIELLIDKFVSAVWIYDSTLFWSLWFRTGNWSLIILFSCTWWVIFSNWLQYFLLSLVSSNLTVMCLGVDLLFILFGVYWVSMVCRLLFSSNLRNFHHMSLNIFLSFFSLSLQGLQWHVCWCAHCYPTSLWGSIYFSLIFLLSVLKTE